MLLIATDLNGHLRVHPKRVAFMPHPNYLAPKESWWKKFSKLGDSEGHPLPIAPREDFSACWHFLATGQRIKRKSKPNVKFNANRKPGESRSPTSGYR
eukprot:g24836.t1